MKDRGHMPASWRQQRKRDLWAPRKVSGTDFAKVRGRSSRPEALCWGLRQATRCCLQPGLLGPWEPGRKWRREVVGGAEGLPEETVFHLEECVGACAI